MGGSGCRSPHQVKSSWWCAEANAIARFGAAPKAVAPGQPQPFRVTIPAGVGIVGIVGARLEEWRPGGRAAFDSPGRPIAIVSNVRVDYTPR